MQKKKTDWRIETIESLTYYKRRIRLLKLIEILYHTILPIFFTYLMVTQRNLFYIPLLLFIIFVRVKIK